MIAYLHGKLVYKSPTELIMDVGGVGYRLYISLQTYQAVQALEQAKLLTHHLVKEDQEALYGFATAEELQLFEQLISVSGVGANTARVLLSAMSAKEIRAAIIAENVAVLKSAKGIGPKSAKRIILELKDKLLKESGAVSEAIAASIQGQTAGENPIRSEALDALLALGFNKIKAQKVLNSILKTKPNIQDVGQLIKLALAQMT